MRLAVPAPFGVGTVFFCANSEETFHRARTNGTLTSIAAVRSIAPNVAMLVHLIFGTALCILRGVF